MRYLRSVTAAAARILLSAIFLVSGINKIIYWNEAEKQFMRVIGDWQTYTAASGTLQAFFSAIVVWAPMILMLATFIEILGSLLLLFGIKEKLGAGLLVIFLIPMTVLLQHFWFVEGSQSELQLSFFLRDFAVLGGLLIVVLHGGHGNTSQSDEDSFSRMS